MAYEINEQKKVGLGLIGFSIFFSFLGIALFFDRGLLALGNIFLLAGVAILLGWYSTWKLFTNRANYKGSAAFFLGLFLIFVRWPILGIIVQIYGCIILFGGFWPTVKVMDEALLGRELASVVLSSFFNFYVVNVPRPFH